MIWNKLAYSGEPKLSRHPHNSYAAGDARHRRHVLVLFGSEGLYAFELDGTLLWQRDLGVLDPAAFDLPDYQWGSHGPVIYKPRKSSRPGVLNREAVTIVQHAQRRRGSSGSPGG
jgi:hypothetical protein